MSCFVVLSRAGGGGRPSRERREDAVLRSDRVRSVHDPGTQGQLQGTQTNPSPGCVLGAAGDKAVVFGVRLGFMFEKTGFLIKIQKSLITFSPLQLSDRWNVDACLIKQTQHQ